MFNPFKCRRKRTRRIGDQKTVTRFCFLPTKADDGFTYSMCRMTIRYQYMFSIGGLYWQKISVKKAGLSG